MSGWWWLRRHGHPDRSVWTGSLKFAIWKYKMYLLEDTNLFIKIEWKLKNQNDQNLFSISWGGRQIWDKKVNLLNTLYDTKFTFSIIFVQQSLKIEGIFGSNRSPRCQDVCLCVCACVCDFLQKRTLGAGHSSLERSRELKESCTTVPFFISKNKLV